MEISDEGDISEAEECITMVDVERHQKNLVNEIVNHVGDDNLTSCSYEKGYYPLQGVHICLTCQPESTEMAGICVACALECHSEHKTYQIGPKRYFRCDCGNDKFVNICNIFANKCDLNFNNKYNHNFRNRFCVCDCVYEAETSQYNSYLCTICEDWFHIEHLDNIRPAENQDFICLNCSQKFPFLSLYQQENNFKTNDGCLILNKKIQDNVSSLCMPEDWRQNICKCESCIEMYKNSELLFLLDQRTDPNHWAQKGTSLYMPSIEDIYNKLCPSDKEIFDFKARDFLYLEKMIKKYLEKFKLKKKVVTKKDIKAFFKELRKKKSKFYM